MRDETVETEAEREAPGPDPAGGLRRVLVPVLGVGIVGGLAGFGYLAAMHVLERTIGPERFSGGAGAIVLVSAGVVVALLTRWLGEPGDVELLVDNIHVLGGAKDIRDVRSLVPVSLVCIGAGGAAGPEAPLVQTTGAFGTWLAGRTGASRIDRRVLTITGMASGFTVLFGLPLGAAIFALEILHRRGLEYYEALMPAVIGSLCGHAVYTVASGLGLRPVWSFPPVPALRPVDLAFAVAAGAAGAAVAALFTGMNRTARAAFRRLPGPARPVLVGAALAGLAAWTPYALTFGERQLGGLVHARPATVAAAVALFATAAAAKLLATTVTISGGWRGGFIIPLFLVGASLGRLVHAGLPATNEVVLMAALMAAINTGVTKTPIGSTLVVAGMGGLRLLPTTLLAAVVAWLLTSPVGLIETQRARDPARGRAP